MSDLTNSDIKMCLKELGDESTSPDRINTDLNKLLIALSLGNKDFGPNLFDNGIVVVLVNLFNGEKGKSFRAQITNIIVSLSLLEDNSEKNNFLDVILTALANISSKSSLNVLLECISGIKDIATYSDASSSSPSSSSSSHPSPPAHFLSLASAALVFEKVTAVLSSSVVRDGEKQQVLDTLFDVVDAGVMNEAVEFVGWRSTLVPPAGKKEEKQKGDGEGSEDDLTISVSRFSNAFSAFADVVKGISQTKKRSSLAIVTEKISVYIQENRFFPTFTLLHPKSTFLANSVSTVVNLGDKLVWTGDSYNVFFVNPEINEGIYKIVVNGQQNNSSQLWMCLGLALKSLLPTLATTYFHALGSGTCCLHPEGVFIGKTQPCTVKNFPRTGKVTLGLELDANRHILHFFVNNAQVPYCVTNVPPSVHFGVGSYNLGGSFELKSFVRLFTPSVNPSLTCTQYTWI